MSANPLYAELDAINAKLTQAIASQEIDSLDDVLDAIEQSVQYLSDGEREYHPRIEQAIEALAHACRRINEYIKNPNDDDSQHDDAKELLKADYRQRVRDVKEHTR